MKTNRSLRLTEREWATLQASRRKSALVKISFPEPSEAEWQAEVERIADLFGWRHYHTRNSRGSNEDFPDLVMLRDKRLIVVELKVGDKQATPGQFDWLEAFRQAGAETYVWRPADAEEIMRILR